MTTTFTYFDTRVDTIKYFVPMTISFKLRNYQNKEKLSPIYLHVSSHGIRERIHLDLWINQKYWNKEKSKLIGPQKEVEDDNLILDSIRAKITKIKKFYKLADKTLTHHAFLHEFKNNLSRADFVSFFKGMLIDRKGIIQISTLAKERSVYNKLKEFREEILFHEINESFFIDYRNFLAKKGNQKTTRNGNIKILKKYLRLAEKKGAKLGMEINDIKAGPTSGNKFYLNAKEVEKCYKYYKSDFIPNNQKLALGYFLFSCFTGLRFSDLMTQERKFLKSGAFTFIHVKTKKTQVIQLNKKATKIMNICKDLFVKKYSNNHTRKLVQKICEFLQINKPIDFHMSRHTFGTNCILVGEPVTKVQILMNHSDLKETMVYVHLAELERNAKADLLDNLF